MTVENVTLDKQKPRQMPRLENQNWRYLKHGEPCRGTFAALHFLHQFRQLRAEAGGLGIVSRPLAPTSWLSRYAPSGNLTPSAQANMNNGVFKQGVKPLDFLNRLVSLWHRHLYNLLLCLRG